MKEGLTINHEYPTVGKLLLARIEESLLLALAPSFVALGALVYWGIETGFATRELPFIEECVMWVLAAAAVLISGPSFFGLVTYVIFLPSLTKGGHLLARVHARHMVHPMSTALLLAVLALGIVSGSLAVWGLWVVMLVAYLAQTTLMLRAVLAEAPPESREASDRRTWSTLAGLVLGGELVALAAGAKLVSPWRIHELPEDTWIIDVRTKPEFHWNRLEGAENYPWGAGIAEAAQHRPKDRPVLVSCLSGHRSPAVAAMIRRLGFEEVYNLNWGILYLILLERGRTREGRFALTRAHRDPHRRGEDLRGITIAYITLILVTLVAAPLEASLVERAVPEYVSWLGAGLGVLGLILGGLSFRALGRNFRVFAAPRRSGTLITSGVYSMVRHPMYTGVIVGLGGYVLMFGALFCVPLWMAVTALYTIKSIKEERIIEAKFPEYHEYRKKTWRLIPYLF
ncbi:MAG: methyltransferase [Thermodesulfobacteriota bacterium]